MIYFRPVIINQQAYHISKKTLELLDLLSKKYDQPYKINLSKTETRNYKKCHQMFHFPVFCADGRVYLCCENKGNPQFELCVWDQGDFRDHWLDSKHLEIYERTRVDFCQPCRPNFNNIQIQNVLDNPRELEKLYL